MTLGDPKRTPRGYRLRYVLAAGLLLSITGTSRANERYDTWQAERPYTLAGYGTHAHGGGGKLDIDYFLGSGLNTAVDIHCSYNSSREMADLGDLPAFYFVYGDKMPDLEGFIADFEKARRYYRNIVGLLLGDEVRSTHGEGGLKHMGQIHDWIVNHPDPAVRNLLLITCTPSGGDMSSQEHIRQYMNDTVDRMQPDAILTQMYGIGRPQDYGSLQWFADWSQKRDISMWVIGKAWSSSRKDVPGESELRLQKFANLAYGVRGMFDFLWPAGALPTVRDAGYWNVDGKDNPTTLYKQVAPVNREVANIAKAIVRMHPVRVYHMDSADDGKPGSTAIYHWSDTDADLPTWMRRSPLLANVTGASNRNHLLVAFFRDEAGQEYFMVVNKDIGKVSGDELATRVVLSLHPSVKSVQRLRRDTGKVETIAVDEHCRFDLPGGTGDLFRFAGAIVAAEAFAGVEPVTQPRLVSSGPINGGTVGRLSNNVLRLMFDRDARSVHALIRKLDNDGKPVEVDMGDQLERTLSDDRKALIYRDVKGLLVSDATYQVDLRWADGPSVQFKVVRGDVDGDGSIAQSDADAVKKALGAKGVFMREDLDGDGTVSETDLRFARRTVEPLVFDWSEDFEAYNDGNLAGQGPWLAAETLPGSVLSKSWVAGDAMVGTAMSHIIQGSKSATTTQSGLYMGNEARFLQNVGAGGVGHLIVDVTGRVNTDSFHNHGLHLWNSQDVEGDQGGFSFEIEGGSVIFRKSRGIVLGRGTTSASLESVSGATDIAVYMDVDFGAGTLTWSCTDVTHSKTKGPFVVPFTGSAAGIDGISFILRGSQGAIDKIRIQGR